MELETRTWYNDWKNDSFEKITEKEWEKTTLS